MINGGGDVSVQSSGVSINLITKSGSNVFKGSAVGTLTNDAMQFQNVTEELFKKGTGGFLSGAPLNRVSNVTFEYRRPICATSCGSGATPITRTSTPPS